MTFRAMIRLNYLAALVVVCAALCNVAVVAGCGARPAHTAILAVGGTADALHAANREAYRVETDRIGAANRAAGGTAARYDELTAPVNAAFRARGTAISALVASLHAAARVNDAVRDGVSFDALRGAARDVLAALRSAVAALESGAVLPAVQLPSEVGAALRLLESIAGGGRDGG